MVYNINFQCKPKLWLEADFRPSVNNFYYYPFSRSVQKYCILIGLQPVRIYQYGPGTGLTLDFLFTFVKCVIFSDSKFITDCLIGTVLENTALCQNCTDLASLSPYVLTSGSIFQYGPTKQSVIYSPIGVFWVRLIIILPHNIWLYFIFCWYVHMFSFISGKFEPWISWGELVTKPHFAP